jgi:hypothetical protein
MTGLNTTQIERLLAPLNPARVQKMKQGGTMLSHLSQQDVRAHLIRMFGYGGFSLTTDEATVLFETETGGRWMVGYRVTMTLTIRDPQGFSVATYSESACGEPMGPMGSRADAHDFAVKTASSQAMKRCAMNLGDQFGLSLYDKGSTQPIVKATLVGNGEVTGDIQHPVPVDPASQVGTDEPVDEPGDGQVDEVPEPIVDPAPIVDEEAERAKFVAWQSKVDKGLATLSTIDDPADRIKRVANVKRAEKDNLDRTVMWKGSEVTLGKALDMLASDALAPASKS